MTFERELQVYASMGASFAHGVTLGADRRRPESPFAPEHAKLVIAAPTDPR